MDTLFGLVMLAGFIFGIVRVFGGAKNSPDWLNIVTGIILCLDLLVFIWMANQL